MKKWISLFMAATMLLGLCACGSKASGTVPNNEPPAGEVSAPAADKPAPAQSLVAAPAQDTPATPAKSTAAPAKNNAPAGKETATAYVRVEKTQTDLGTIEIPRFDETKLNSKDAAMANAMFANLRDLTLERVAECKAEWGEEDIGDAYDALCETQISENGRILSVLVHYIILYPTSVPMDAYEAVNFDTVTGKAFDPHEVIKGAGYTEEEVKSALIVYTDNCHYYEWANLAYYTAANEGELLSGIGDPSYQWYEQTQELVKYYDAQPTPEGEAWDKLPRYPTVYATGDGLQVKFTIPTEAGAGYYDAMVNIGRDYTETIFLNPNNPYGQPFGRGALVDSVAAEGLIQYLELDESYTVESEPMEMVVDGDEHNPCYVYNVSGPGEQAGLYAVNVFNSTRWKKDASGEWSIIINGTGFMPEDLVTGAHAAGILASIWNWPSEFDCWAANPRTEVDLIEYSSDSNHYSEDCSTLVLYAPQDNTVVTFEEGTPEGDGFAPQRQYASFTLDAGNTLVVYFKRPQSATQAIVVTTPDATGTYLLQYTDPEYMNTVEYITSDLTAG